SLRAANRGPISLHRFSMKQAANHGRTIVRAGARVAFAVSLTLAIARPAAAHNVHAAVLALKELSPGRFAVRWSPPSDGTSAFRDTQPRFPEHCRREGEAIVDCGQRGLVGVIRFDGGAAFSGVSVDIEWLRGRRELRMAAGDPAAVQVSGTPS